MKAWQQLNEYWEGLQPRERVALLAGAAVLLVATLYFFLWQPLMSSRAEMRQEVAQQRALLRWMNGAASEARRLRGSGAGNRMQGGQSLLSLVDQSARKAALGGVVKRVEPDGKQVRIWLEGAGFDKLVGWLERLERDNGVSVVKATIERADSPGVVNARLRLSGGGA